MSKVGLTLIKAKFLSMASAVQPDIDPWNLSAPPQAFALHWQDSGEHHLGLQAFDPHSQSHPITLDMLKVRPHHQMYLCCQCD